VWTKPNVFFITNPVPAHAQSMNAYGPSTALLFASFIFSLGVGTGRCAEPGGAALELVEELDVMVPMRDGFKLATDIYRPVAEGTFPAILARTPYDKSSGWTVQDARFFAEKGYVFVVQDTRGMGKSRSKDGFTPGSSEAKDGYDTQMWLGTRPWCTGKIGTYGPSYLGVTQWMAAPLGCPYLISMCPEKTAADQYNNMTHFHGVFRLRFMTFWAALVTGPPEVDRNAIFGRFTEINKTLPLVEMDKHIGWDIPFLRDTVSSPLYDAKRQEKDFNDAYPRVKAAVLHIGGWYDLFARGTLQDFQKMTAPVIDPAIRARQRLIMGPWVHNGRNRKVGEVDFGPEAEADITGALLEWYDLTLKGIDRGIGKRPPVRIFIMGTNVWRDEHEWPLARTEYQSWYFDSAGNARSLHGNGTLSSTPPSGGADVFTYDPDAPVPTLSDASFLNPMDFGPTDQRRIEEREDVLVYTSAALANDIEVTGPVRVILHASSSAVNTDFTAKLCDVHPDGRAMRLCDGILRASFRESDRYEKPIEPGKAYSYSIDVGATSNVFKKDHRIRVELSSSNFPLFDRNLNTGGNAATETNWVKATQTVFHTKERPSCIVLPVIGK
jgi:hypothetical protein